MSVKALRWGWSTRHLLAAANAALFICSPHSTILRQLLSSAESSESEEEEQIHAGDTYDFLNY